MTETSGLSVQGCFGLFEHCVLKRIAATSVDLNVGHCLGNLKALSISSGEESLAWWMTE